MVLNPDGATRSDVANNGSDSDDSDGRDDSNGGPPADDGLVLDSEPTWWLEMSWEEIQKKSRSDNGALLTTDFGR
ncbi:MAG: hypothetical protein L6R37_005343 [Teloschistes peruensis]|nr:MAG: hypothetical protein L6R37_005343 [Teloschistes peruensis]